MALTGENYQRLVNAKLTDYLDKNKAFYKKMAQTAYDYTKGYVTAAGLPVRPDDVRKALEPALRVSPKLETRLAQGRLTQQLWFGLFADLILDQFWEELNK
jgi:hypothetical protein